MREDQARRLWEYRPTTWQIDLTPPALWDEELTMQDVVGNLGRIFQQFGMTVSSSLTQAVSAIEASKIAEAADPLQDLLKAYELLETNKSYVAPVRTITINTGPPWNPYAKGGRGGR